MITRFNESKVRLLSYVVLLILVFDILTIISNIYIAPVLQGYGMPDILIYIKLIISFVTYMSLHLWLRDKDRKLSIAWLKMLLYTLLIVTVSYFISLYLYKYYLIDQTATVIRTQILGVYGNTSLLLELSRMNLYSLNYITGLFNGFNSEIILFFEAFLIQMFIYKALQYEILDEKKVIYDPFLYKNYIHFVSIVHFLLAFLSINLFQFRYNLIESIEMGVAFMLFAVTLLQMISSFYIQDGKHTETRPSVFALSHKLMMFLSILSFALAIGLIGINLYYIVTGIGTYRITTTIMIVISSIYLFTVSRKVLEFENK